MELRFNARFRNIDNQLHEIRIFKDAVGVTSINIDTTRGNPSLDYRLREQIFASTLRFSFVTSDTTNFDELLSASAKEYRADYYIAGVLKWTGYMVPNQISRNYHGHTYTYTLKFSDGLGDLKNFKPSISSTGRQTLLAFIKECLSFTDLALDFAIIDNKTEANSTINTTPIAECTLMNARWLEIKSGRTVTTDAQKILSNILKSFGLYITQFDNKWYIFNAIEVGSTIYFHNWSDLVQSSTGTNSATTNLQNYNYEKSSDYLKKEPIREASLTFENKNIPSNLIELNPNFTTNDLSFFAVSGPAESERSLFLRNETMILGAYTPTTGTTDGVKIDSDPVAVDQLNNDDIIRVEFDYRLEQVIWDTGSFSTPIYIDVNLVNGTTVQSQTFQLVETGFKRFSYDFANNGADDYHVEIIINYDDGVVQATALELAFDNFEILSLTADGANTNTTFDRFFSLTNTDIEDPFVKDDITLLVGDGIQTNDVGNLKIGTNLTSSWSSYNGTENLTLQELYLRQLLKKNSKYRNELNLTFYEENFNVFSVYRQFLVDSIRYNVEELRIDFNAKHYIYNVKLVELIDTSINTEETSVVLRQVNGEQISGANSVSEVDPTVPSHVKDITTSDITNWNTAKTLQEVTEQGRTTNQGIIIKNTADTHQVELTVNPDGNVILTAGTDKNFHLSGDAIAFSDLTPPAGTWWDSMPAATTTTIGGIKVGNNLTIAADGTLNASAGTSGSPTSDTLQDVTGRGATTDRRITSAGITTDDSAVFQKLFTTNLNTFHSIVDIRARADSETLTIQNGFGSAISFSNDRGDGDIRPGAYIISQLDSGAEGTSDKHNLSIQVRDDETWRDVVLFRPDGTSFFYNSIDVQGQSRGSTFRSDWGGNNADMRTASGTNRYGNWNLYGHAQNGWDGLNFSNTDIDILIKNDQMGFHRAGSGWSMLVNSGTTTTSEHNIMFRNHWDLKNRYAMTFRDDWLRLNQRYNGSAWYEGGFDNGVYLYGQRIIARGNADNTNNIEDAFTVEGGRMHINNKDAGIWFNSDTLTRHWFLGNNDNDTEFRLWGNGTNRFIFNQNGNFTATGESTAFSDRRLKKNIKTYELDLEKFDKLRTVSYSRNREQKTGFIAQEVQELFPEFVHEQNDSDKTLSLNYAQMIALATTAIQETRKETQKEIDNLKKANDRLRKRILKLEKK